MILLLSLSTAFAGPDPAHTIWLDNGFGAPTGFYGLRYTQELSETWDVEGGAGLGFTGWQIAALGHRRWVFGDKGRGAWLLGGGPSLAIMGEPVGTAVPHADDVTVDPDKIYTTSWLNLEGAVQTQGKHLGFRLTLGFALKATSSMDTLCASAPAPKSSSEVTDCYPRHTASGPKLSLIHI